MLPSGDSTGKALRPGVKVAGVLIAFAVCLRLAHLALVAPTPLVGFHKDFVDSDKWFFDQWVRRIVAGDWLGRERFHPLAAWQLPGMPLRTRTAQPFYLYRVIGNELRQGCSNP